MHLHTRARAYAVPYFFTRFPSFAGVHSGSGCEIVVGAGFKRFGKAGRRPLTHTHILWFSGFRRAGRDPREDEKPQPTIQHKTCSSNSRIKAETFTPKRQP